MKIGKNNNGITLIALVVTIIVIIILATISINGVFGENGLLHRAKLEQEKTYNSIHGDEGNLNHVISIFENGTKKNEENLNTNTADPGPNTNTVNPEPEPEPDTTDPTVNVTVNSKGYDTISVKVTATDDDSGLGTNPVYKYYIRPSTSNQFSYIGSGGTTYTFNNLYQNTQYYIQATVDDTAGNTGTGNTNTYTNLCSTCNASGKEEKENTRICNECEEGVIIVPCEYCGRHGYL